MEAGFEQTSTETHRLKAERFADVGRFDLAELELRKALSRDPEDGGLHSALALQLWRQKRLGEAEEEFREALARNPEDAYSLRQLGAILMDLGRHCESERCLIDAIRMEPEHADGPFHYGVLMRKTRRFKKSERLLRYCLTLAPRSPNVYGQLAITLAARKNWREAIALGRNGLELDPGRARSHYLLALTYFETCHPFKAREHMREALRMEPTNAGYVATYQRFDVTCQWTTLPLYHYRTWVRRMPGREATLVVLLCLIWQTPVGGWIGQEWSAGVVWVIALIVLYSWLAPGVEALRVRWRRLQ